MKTTERFNFLRAQQTLDRLKKIIPEEKCVNFGRNTAKQAATKKKAEKAAA